MISPERNTLESLLALSPKGYRNPVDPSVLSKGAALSDGTRLRFAGAVSTFLQGAVACFIREDQALEGVQVMNARWLGECRGACLITGVDNGLVRAEIIVPDEGQAKSEPIFRPTELHHLFRRTV